MLTQVAEGVLVHQSELLENNAVVVQGRAGVLLVDPGLTDDEMTCLASDLRELGQPVVAGFATHPDWDHVLWHAELGDAPRLRHRPLRGRHAGPAVATRTGRPAPPRGCRRRSPTRYRWTCSASSPVCPPEPTQIPWDGPARPDHRASGPRPGPCGAVDRGTRGPRGRRHAVRRLGPDARRLRRHQRPGRGLPRRAAAAGGRGGRRRRRRPWSRVGRRSRSGARTDRAGPGVRACPA